MPEIEIDLKTLFWLILFPLSHKDLSRTVPDSLLIFHCEAGELISQMWQGNLREKLETTWCGKSIEVDGSTLESLTIQHIHSVQEKNQTDIAIEAETWAFSVIYFLETHKILNTRELLQVHNSIDQKSIAYVICDRGILDTFPFIWENIYDDHHYHIC